MITLKKILVPTDFSECSEAALRYGFELAHTFNATLHLLHVVEDPNTTPWAAEGFPLSLVEVLEGLQDESRKRLLASVPDADRGRVVVFCPIASPVPEILRYAKDEFIDLIVMGTHGRGVVAHALIGSVAERVVRRAPCPVLTVRQAQHSFLDVSTRPACATVQA
jgi:nucleotide-binding universal stress UspA family protein